MKPGQVCASMSRRFSAASPPHAFAASLPSAAGFTYLLLLEYHFVSGVLGHRGESAAAHRAEDRGAPTIYAPQGHAFVHRAPPSAAPLHERGGCRLCVDLQAAAGRGLASPYGRSSGSFAPMWWQLYAGLIKESNRVRHGANCGEINTVNVVESECPLSPRLLLSQTSLFKAFNHSVNNHK